MRETHLPIIIQKAKNETKKIDMDIFQSRMLKKYMLLKIYQYTILIVKDMQVIHS